MKISVRILFLLLTLVLIACAGCYSTALPEPASQPTLNPMTAHPAPTSAPETQAWWRDIVFYEIFVRSFKDSDGDGIGDFQGIIQQLDYLNDGNPNTHDDLGIQGIWLMPINPSPSYHGYDVMDYYTVNPDYGTMDDFKQLLAEAEKRDIKIIIDLVINHTSTQHPWFQAAQDPTSEFHDWYVWSAEHPQIPGPWFQNAWHRNSVNNLYYYGIFWGGMPDLNFGNPAVSDEMMSITKFWLEEVGVHGFRVDAARYLYADGVSQQDTKQTIQWFEDWRAFYKAINPSAFTVGEVWTDLQVTARYGDGMDSLFMFDLAEDIINGVYVPNPRRTITSYQDIQSFFPEGDFSTFLSNHDQQRVMSFFEGDTNKARVAAFVYLTGPGVPFIYYGEEIGMKGNKPDELLRTPMQWSGEPGAGFTSGTPWQPVNQDYSQVNVAAQDADPDSLLKQYRTLVHLRNQNPALRNGAYLPFTASCQQLYPILRVEDDQVLFLLANLSRRELEGCTINIAESPLSGKYDVEMLYGDGVFSDFNFGEDGSLAEYSLPEIIQPFQQFILQLNES
ncbi:MAG TPA: alpha-amylase family glycosyl hydrolase [Brevefilum sp.]|nr:alpha-amylase family glycosyl hydrolase [Brevefilum sp.]HOR18696.1 alpha-amylase family glycosyl hydrolase [Brevefilum sp.]HPL68597.1 alpha-amylase family glycosyl hydrolase [Brevefilum sp.]